MTLTACSVFQVQKTESAGTEVLPNMPNPAAVDCEIGKQLVIKTAADGSQSSECVDPDGSGGYMPPESTEEIANWWGVIKSTGIGAQYDDYFERQDLGQIISFGIDAMDPAVQAQIMALRDSGKIIHLHGTLFSNMPDVNGSQIQVDRIEVGVQGAGGYMPPGTSEEIADWRGVIKSTAPGSQYDDYFELWTNGQIIYFGIDSVDPAVKSQIESFRNSGKIVNLYGMLLSNVPDYNGSQIQVDRIEVEE